MATISTVTDTTMFQIKRWLGLHESPEGDTRLKLGEASEMRNWCVTHEGSLQLRRGTQMVRKFGARSRGEWLGTPIMGMWSGFLYDRTHLLVASGGKVYDVDYLSTESTTNYMDDHFGEFPVTELGDVELDEHVEFMPYNGVLYVLDGHEMQKWDGNSGSLVTVAGYVPTTTIACACATGVGRSLEEINLLTTKRIVWYSVTAAEATAAAEDHLDVTVFSETQPLAATPFTLRNRATGNAYTGTQIEAITETRDSKTYLKAVRLKNGAIVPSGPNVLALEFDLTGLDAWDFRSEITANRYWEYYNGDNDNRVFLYGDGTNVYRYSGLDDQGTPTAEYFPAINQGAVGEANTPITGMIRHFSMLLCFKTTSTYSIAFTTQVLDDQSVKPGFYNTPTNRELGNDAMGQVRLMNNSAVTACNGNILLWHSSTKTGALTYDERQARILSDRVDKSVKVMDFKQAYMYDCNYDTEFYICQGGQVLVYNYGLDVWYRYTNLRVKCMTEIDHVIFMGMEDGSLRRFTRNARGDYGYPRVAEVFDGTNPLTNLPYGGDGDEPWFTSYYDSADHAMKHCYVKNGFPYYIGTELTLLSNTPVLIDDGIQEIDALWRSGTLTFDRDWKRKISMVMWLNVLPESGSEFWVKHISDRRSVYPEKIISFPIFGFGNIDFRDFSFGHLKFAKVHRVKMRVKKYVFYQLILESKSKTATATVLDADIQVRYWANVK